MSIVEQRLEQIARVPVLLVVTDFDGTISPIVEDPGAARPLPEAVVALRTLAGLPQTHVAVVSGRALRDLATLAGLPREVHLVGSHGTEFDSDFATSLPQHAVALRQRLLAELAAIAATGDGLMVENKPASVAFHYRNARRDVAARAVEAVENGPARFEGVVTRRGKEVIELAVVESSKGLALDTLRARAGASGVVFFGDDRTDEDAFGTLTGPDVGVKVGEGESRAEFRVEDPVAVARLLARLAGARAGWLAAHDSGTGSSSSA